MKVGVDGILLGAWATATPAKRILDIGTGTGLIALMLAQRNAIAKITAIEIDPKASTQAQENFWNSPWSERLELVNLSFQDFLRENVHTFDLIVSNPPFFKGQQLEGSRQLAREQSLLTPIEIIEHHPELLSKNGRIALILPKDLAQQLEQDALALGLQIQQKTEVRPTPSKEGKRTLLELSPNPTSPHINEISIEVQRHQYSDEYKELTQNFLLKNSPKNQQKHLQTNT